MSEPTQDLLSQLSTVNLIVQSALRELPRYSTDPNKQPKESDLPAQVTKVVDLFEQIASTTELPRDKTILDLPLHVAMLFAELQQRRAFMKGKT